MCTPWAVFPREHSKIPRAAWDGCITRTCSMRLRRPSSKGRSTMMPKPFWFPTHKHGPYPAKNGRSDLSPLDLEAARADAAGVARLRAGLPAADDAIDSPIL